METFVIQTENSSQTKAVKKALEALQVEMKPVRAEDAAPLPNHISKILNKGLAEADKEEFTVHEEFMGYIKSKYEK